jgi:dienelactone hydrolase
MSITVPGRREPECLLIYAGPNVSDMNSLPSTRLLTVAFVVLTLVGLGTWAVPLLSTVDDGGPEYTVERVHVRDGGRLTDATLYLPRGDGTVPGVVFGAGSGTTPALYSNYGAALAEHGFAVLIGGGTKSLEPDRPVEWEIRNERDVLLERAAASYLAWADYLAAHPRVDGSRLVFAGHSGGANSAYRAAYERPDVDGVVAIAGRFPPARDAPLETNLLLATGSDDGLVPPATLTEVAEQLVGRPLQPGERVGRFETDSAAMVVVADGAGHLSESYDPMLVRTTTTWALRAVGQTPPPALDVTVRPAGAVLRQFLAGLVGVVGLTALSRQLLAGRVADRSLARLLPAVALVGFATVAQTTVSRHVVHLTPMAGQLAEYAVLAAMLLAVLAAGQRVATATGRFTSTAGSVLFDLVLVAVCVGAFVLVSTRFVTFQLVTTTVLSSAVLALLGPFVVALALLGVDRPARWLFLGPAVLWLLPAIVPPYL